MTLRLALLAVGWTVGWWLLWRLPRVRRVPSPDDAPRGAGRAPVDVTVVVPARNEEASLPKLLASLDRQSVRPTQVIVVDDGSSDATAEIARGHPGVTLVEGAPLPPGWTGKTWALHQGVAVAEADTLVFLDADVRLDPDALTALLEEHGRRGGLVSVQPYHHTERAYEQLAAYFNIIAVMGVGMASPGRDGRAHAAFGPCLVTSRADYERAGGHEAVRGEIIEDVALGRAYDDAGLPVAALGGGGLVSFRMYPKGPGQLIEGFSKNMATGARSVPPVRALAIFGWVVASLVSVQTAVEWAMGMPGAASGGVAAVVAAGFALQTGTHLRRLGDFTWLTALLYPLPLGFFVAIFARSLWLTVVRRQVRWSGRPVPLSRERRWAGAAIGSDG